MTYRKLLALNKDFRRLWLGQVVSEIGDWLNNIAVLALAIELASDRRVGLAIAVYAVARHLPLFVFGPIAGIVVDRLSRQRVMIAADIVRAALALGFIFADSRGSLIAIYIVGAALFSISAFFNAAKRAATPNIVRGAEELLAANSLSASTTAATIAVGSALGGLVATFIGRETVFIVNALTFLISAELIRRIRTRTEKERTVAHEMAEDKTVESRSEFNKQLDGKLPSTILKKVFSEFSEGIRYVRGEPVLASIFMVAAGWGMGNGAARSLYSIFGARLGESAVAGWSQQMRLLIERPGEFGISVLFIAMGLGGVLGAPLARRFNAAAGAGLGARLGRSMTLDGCALALFSMMPGLWTGAVVLVMREINFAIWWTAQQTILMKRTNDRYAGRVYASYETLTTLMMVGSMLISGASADEVGIRPVAFVGGLVITCSGLLWLLLQRRGPLRRANII